MILEDVTKLILEQKKTLDSEKNVLLFPKQRIKKR
jgi:hypothetical protein